MKKLIVFSLVFALITGAVFAQVSIGGSVGFGAQLIEGDSSEKGDDDPAIYTNLNAHWGEFHFVWASDDGAAGSKIKVNSDFNKDGGEGGFPLKMGGNVWWRPAEWVRLEFTNIEDEGVFGRGNAIDWGYQANSSAGNANNLWGGGWNSFSNAALRSGNGFFGGLGGNGENVLALSLFPIDGLAVNFAWDLANGAGGTEEFFKHTVAQITYDINGIGNLGVSFAAGDDYNGLDGWAGLNLTAHTFAVDFTLTMLQGMNVEVSGKIPLSGKKGGDVYDNDADDFLIPIEVGLGYTLNQWSSEAFQLFARVGLLLPTDDYEATHIGIDINPSYDIGLFRVFFDLGMAMIMPKDSDFDTALFWHFTPYLKKSLGIGDLYVGFSLWNGASQGGYESVMTYWQNDDKDKGTGLINFAIPIYFEVAF
ncbi:MAG: hypothetical protein LBH97_01520 [Treponema sp.]|nr:hypothetical protein [Treponema sp.]